MPTSWQRSLRRGAGVTGRPGRPCRNARLGLGKASLLCCAVLFWAEASLSGPTGQAGQADRAGLVLGPSLDFQHLSGDQEKRYILETTGSGVALFDYDGDGDLDIYLVNASTLDRLAAGTPGEPNRLFRNEGGSAYVDVTELAGVGDRGFGQGVAAADFDNDGDLDLYVTNYGPKHPLPKQRGRHLLASPRAIVGPRLGSERGLGRHRRRRLLGSLRVQLPRVRSGAPRQSHSPTVLSLEGIDRELWTAGVRFSVRSPLSESRRWDLPRLDRRGGACPWGHLPARCGVL